METRAKRIIDLAMCQVQELPRTLHFGRPLIYLVEAGDTDNDIYRILGISGSKFSVYITKQFGGFASHMQGPGSLGEVYVYVVEKEGKRGGHHSTFRSIEREVVQVTISGTFSPAKFATRLPQEYEDDFVAVMTYSLGDGRRIHVSSHPSSAERVFRLVFGEDRVTSQGKPIEIGVVTQLYQGYGEGAIDFSLATLSNLRRNIRVDGNDHNLMLRLARSTGMTGTSVLKTQGIKSALERVLPFYEELLQEENTFLIAVFQTLVFESKRTINGVKVSKYFNEYFGGVDTAVAFKAKLEEVYAAFLKFEADPEYWRYEFEKFFPTLPNYAALRKTALQSQSGKALAKMVGDIDAIQFDESRYPLLSGLIRDGSIPVSTFFRKEGDETYFTYNDNWDLFEEFLGKYRDVGIELAKLASQRTTYEKSFMSYLYFVLYDLPEYLKSYTGKDWTCIPQIVSSVSELEPERTAPGATSKKRSALTPIVDNEKCEVIVPYACLKVPGVSTTYTYSLNYSVVRRGFSIDGNVCTKDIEHELNGRDDYGLMFYTLTGSVVGRGYPTFLIIFERLEGGARVHFHRTYPLRSKGGEHNPVNNWIRTCYNWMAGNINLDRIAVQQGDLVFVEIDELPVGERQEVNSYDSHMFESPVTFVPCTKKNAENVLGYFKIAAPTVLRHPEHRERNLNPGSYELRQCRSWEANPKGVWSLRID